MLIGSIFSGIGGLDITCEWAWPGSRTAWQLDIVGAAVRRRHWPDALQVEADVRTVCGSDLPRVDVLCGGFPCQDLSCAGKQAGLDGDRSGLYREVLRLGGEIQPRWVVIENVPGLLSYMARLGRDFAALGYGLSWAVCEAADAGHPHLRRRVFVLAEAGVSGRGPIPVDTSGRWSPEEDVRTWATACAADPNGLEDAESWHARRAELAARHGNNGAGEPLGQQVRTWATPKGSDARSPGASVSTARGADGLACEVRCWPTTGASDAHSVVAHKGGNPSLTDAIRTWPTTTTTTTDDRTPAGWVRPNGHDIARIGEALLPSECGRRLNPAWVEALMGLPTGWTLPDGDRLEADPRPRAVRGRYPATWDRSVPWPDYDWEPSRTIPDGPPCLGRPVRIRALGNAVVPQQAALALRALLGEPAQASLFTPIPR